MDKYNNILQRETVMQNNLKKMKELYKTNRL